MIAVTDPTGPVGRHVVAELRRDGTPLQLASEPHDAAAVLAALQGASLVLREVPPGGDPAVAEALTAVLRSAEAAPAAGAPRALEQDRLRVVTVLAPGAVAGGPGTSRTAPAGRPSHSRVVRAAGVWEQLLEQVATLHQQGVLEAPSAPAPVAAADVADVVLELLRDPGWEGHLLVPVVGPAVSGAQLAAAATTALHRHVRVVEPSDADGADPLDDVAQAATAVSPPRLAATTVGQWCEAVLAPAVAAERAAEVRRAFTHLRAVDPVLAGILDARPGYDPDAWRADIPALDLYGCLVLQLVGQQISLAAAHAIWARLVALVGQDQPEPVHVGLLSQQQLRETGLSWRKAATLIELSARFADGRLSEERLSGLPDDQVVAELTQINGIGPWTVHGALLVRLRRADVVPTGDVMLRNAVKQHYGFADGPTEQQVRDIADAWAPHGSLGANLLFASYEAAEAQRRAAARAAEAERRAAVAGRRAAAAERRATAEQRTRGARRAPTTRSETP